MVAAAEALRGKRGSQRVERWGDWGRDATICVAVRRFAAGLAKDAAKVRFVENMRRRLGQEREEKHP